ncbi:MAG: hypothetical protein LC620_04880, partial [Halobacteriales archaeon]|nr:hypothetical protein [Halobacteriales archaeon]
MASTAQAQTVVPHQAYVDDFAAGKWDQRGPGFVREARREAMAAFARAGFPTTREEAWKHTSLREMARVHFAPVAAPARSLSEAEVAPYRIGGAIELVFVDGHHVSGLSLVRDLPQGVR